jgi:transcriptional regulator with XRE-family HTH domain
VSAIHETAKIAADDASPAVPDFFTQVGPRRAFSKKRATPRGGKERRRGNAGIKERRMTTTVEGPIGAEDCPTCEHVYERIIRDHFGASPLAGVPEESFVREVARRFRKAPTALCARSIGKWINRKLREAGWTQQDLADRIGVDRSAVAYWIRGGNITLDNLAQTLIEFKSQWSELPLPARQELAVAAYLAALTFVRERLDGSRQFKPLDREDFWRMVNLFSESHWATALRLRDPLRLDEEARRVARAVEASLGRRPQTDAGVGHLQRLVAEWGGAWLVCIGLVPRAWAVR